MVYLSLQVLDMLGELLQLCLVYEHEKEYKSYLLAARTTNSSTPGSAV